MRLPKVSPNRLLDEPIPTSVEPKPLTRASDTNGEIPVPAHEDLNTLRATDLDGVVETIDRLYRFLLPIREEEEI